MKFEDLGFTMPLNVGARATALAGAYVSAGDDVHSLIYNPAGLAQIKRIELSLGIQQEHTETKNVFYGNPTGVNSRNGGLDALSVAYPFPTYRGSFVTAFGVYRIYSGLFDLRREGRNSRTESIDNFLLQQTGSIFSYNFGLGVDLSPALSGGFSVFLVDGTIDALTQYDYTLLYSVPSTSVYVKDDLSMDLNGYGGRIGTQLFVHRNFVGGLCFTTPVWISTKGSRVTEITKYEVNALDNYSNVEATVGDEYMIPFRFDMGVSFSAKNTLVALEFGYSDWTEAAVNRKRFRDGTTLETIFAEVFDYRAGVEYSVPWAPVALRVGYAYRPYPSKFLQAERIDDPEKYERGYNLDSERVTKMVVDKQRHQYTVGAGGVFGSALELDAAFVYTDGERSISSVSDERSSSQFLLSASYRF